MSSATTPQRDADQVMRAYAQTIAQAKALMDRLEANREQMQRLRTLARRLPQLLGCAPSVPAVVRDMVGVLGSADLAQAYIEEMRRNANEVADALQQALREHRTEVNP